MDATFLAEQALRGWYTITLYSFLKYFGYCSIVGLLGSRKEIGFTTATLGSFFMTPIFGLGAVIMSDSIKDGRKFNP